jgi:hypothetical protein
MFKAARIGADVPKIGLIKRDQLKAILGVALRRKLQSQHLKQMTK